MQEVVAGIGLGNKTINKNMKKIILIILFFASNAINSQELKFKIVDFQTQKPISNVNICLNDKIITSSNNEGFFTLNTSTKEIIIRKEYYNDVKIVLSDLKSNIIEVVPITTYQLNEIVITSSKSTHLFDKIYDFYKNKIGYETNYHYTNRTINFKNTECKFININEIFYKTSFVKTSNKRIYTIKTIKHDLNFYESIGINGFTKDSKTPIIECKGKSMPIPMYKGDLISKNNFFYFSEIHDFFKNYKKFKYNLTEDENYYSIDYTYKNTYTKFKYNISLIIDKQSLTIINFKKSLIINKNNIFKINLVNTNDKYDFYYISHNEEVTFKLNENSNYELVSEYENIEYENINNTAKLNNQKFSYNIIIEPTIPVIYNENELSNINDIIK